MKAILFLLAVVATLTIVYAECFSFIPDSAFILALLTTAALLLLIVVYYVLTPWGRRSIRKFKYEKLRTEVRSRQAHEEIMKEIEEEKELKRRLRERQRKSVGMDDDEFY